MFEHRVLTRRGVSCLNVTAYDATIASRSEETTPGPGSVSPLVEAGWSRAGRDRAIRTAISRQKLPAPRPPLWRLNGNINIQAGRGVKPSLSSLSTSPHCAELRAQNINILMPLTSFCCIAVLLLLSLQCRVSATCKTEYAARSTVCEATSILMV